MVVVVVGVSGECGNKTTSAPSWGLGWAGAELGNMVFNFSKKYQFNTQLSLNGKEIETVDKAKLLGTMI